jgi:serine/threonine-protein kinase
MSSELREGTVFAGRYRVMRRIATGGMGSVYEVVHLETERRRALKVMHPHILGSEDLRERFKREAKVAAHIESEFIVDVFDAGIDEPTQMPFLVMELLRGEEIGKRLKRMGRLPPVEVVTYLHQTALALDRTHQASIVHRDLKPENLFLTDREDGPPRIKVLDFGIAKIVAESATAGATQSLGTPLYMAPEQFNPRLGLSGATDVYALGMVAYTLLVGSAYWATESRGNVFALAAVAVHGPREPASFRAAARGVSFPPAFDAWFARVTHVDPAQRFATATEAVRALADALGVPSPGRATMASIPQLAPSSAFPPPLMMTPPSVPAFTPAGEVGAPAMGSASLPAAQLTAPGAVTTTHVPAPQRSVALLAVTAAIGVGALLGGVVYAASRYGSPPAAASAPTPAAEPTASASAAPSAVAVTVAAPIESASAAPTASATASADPATRPSATAAVKAPPPPPATQQPVTKKQKYTRD